MIVVQQRSKPNKQKNMPQVNLELYEITYILQTMTTADNILKDEVGPARLALRQKLEDAYLKE